MPTVTSDISYDSCDLDFTDIVTHTVESNSSSDMSHDQTNTHNITHSDTTSSTTDLVPTRQSSRVRKTPSYLSSYKCNLTHNEILNASPHWCNMVRFDTLPSAHRAFLSHTSSITEPRSYKEASEHPLWREAIDKEL